MMVWHSHTGGARLRGMFCLYSLRTTELDAALQFYADALGLVLPHGASKNSRVEAWPLHERARAMGVPAHWLGQIMSKDMEGAVTRLVALGGERLGPTVRRDDGAEYATVRDPSGAVVAVRSGGTPPTEHLVAWHQLHTRDADSAWAMHSELFGWAYKETLDVPNPLGGHMMFAWSDAGSPIGSLGNTACMEGVHAHWLFYFAVPDVAATADRVRALGGTAMDAVKLPNGMRLCACEDPQGAAFGLCSGLEQRALA